MKSSGALRKSIFFVLSFFICLNSFSLRRILFDVRLKLNNSPTFKRILFLLLISFSFNCSFSAGPVLVTPGNISNICQGEDYKAFTSDIVIRETVTINGFYPSPNIVTYEISAPNNYEFKPNTGNVVHNTGDIKSLVFSIGSTKIIISYLCNTSVIIDSIVISDLQMRAALGAVSPINLVRTGGTAFQSNNNVSDANVHAVLASSENPTTISIPSLSLFCNGDNIAYPINASPAGGTYAGPGVTGSNFNPLGLTAGDKIISYTVLSGGCTFIAFVTATVYASPAVALTSSDANNSICSGNNVTFTANTSGTASRYEFRINNIPVTTPGASNTYTTNSLLDGNIVTVRVDNGASTCETISSGITMDVGDYPQAAFSWENTCGTNYIQFTDGSTVSSGSTIISWAWDFDNSGNTDATLTNPDFTYSVAGTYFSKLTVTSDKGCSDNVTVRVYTLPGIGVTEQNPYSVNFNLSNHSWAFDGQNPSWGWGAGKGNFSTATGNIWSTGSVDGLYNISENSFLNTPCFDFTSLDKPMIMLTLWSATQLPLAGAILEASTDGGIIWQRVGTKGNGISWYDTEALLASPGVNNPGDYGWAGEYGGWEIAKIGLDQFKNMPAVRFRISFASPINTQRRTGIALSEVWIGNRDKIVLMEHFTRNDCPAGNPNIIPVKPSCASGDNAVNLIQSQRVGDVASIHYHTSFPEPDPFNLVNQADPSARVLYYGVPSVPISVLDGNAARGNIYTGVSGPGKVVLSDVDREVLERAKFKLDITNVMSPGTIQTRLRITAKENLPAGGLVAYLAIVEDAVGIYQWVLRRMLPDAGGTFFNNSWLMGDVRYITESWNYTSSEVADPANLSAVAFLQSIGTKEIYQVAYLKGPGSLGDPVLTSIEDKMIDAGKMTIYPNPAADQAFVVFSRPVEQDIEWVLYDNIGKEITIGKLSKGAEGFSIDTGNYSEGIYFLKAIDSSGTVIFNKFMVVH